jgi:tape measure domain-containing protein
VSVVANVAINVDSRNAVSKLRQVQQGAQQTERAVGGLGAAIGKLAVAFAGVQAIKFVFTQAAQLQTQARSLEILAGSAEKAGKIIKELQDLGAITPFTSTELIDSAKRLQAFGVETEKVVETTRRLADASGATGAELSGLVTAYGQVQAKGRLQGEELLQFQERGIALQEELRKMYGMTGEEFQKALSKGQVSAKAVEVALINLTNAGGKYANGAIAQSDTLNGKLSTLQDSFQRLAQNIGTFFEPVFKFLIDGINAFLDRVNNGLRVSAQLKANEQAAIQTRQKFGGFRAANPFDQEAQQFEENLRQSLLKSALSTGRGAAPKAPVRAPAAPGLLNAATPGGARGGGGSRAAGGGGASKAADEAKRLAEELQRSVERGDDLFRQFSRQAVLLGTASETERKRLQIQYDYQDRVREINELKNAEQKVNLMAVNDEIRRLQTLELQTEELKKQLEVFYELAGLSMGGMLPGGAGAFRTDVNLDPNDRAQQKIDEYKTKLTELQDPINMAQRGAQGIGDAFSSSFQGIITGTQTAQEALASFFQNIAKSFLDMATEIIAQMVIMYAFKQLLGLFGGGGSGIGAVGNFSGAFSGTASSFNPSSFGMGLLPGRAKGGPVSSGQTYMVGERGPELFVPGRSGTIVANDKMGGGSTNVVVNVDAKGSSVEGNEQGANQLGRVISAAVQSELIKQQRPGGILAR